MSMMNSSNRPTPRNKRGGTGRSGRGVNAKGTGSQNAQAVSYNFEGIYGNPRFSHTLTLLTGCKVQVQVKNGSKYEGIFRTASAKAEFALEMAHKLEETSNHEVASSVPSRDIIIEKLILKGQDIVSLSALDVDMDYATKAVESFATDTMISGKLNGQVTERDLQPWQGDTQPEDGGLEGEAVSSNGWDVNEMLRVNHQKFGVSSTFDEDLSQYTTQLEKKDTKEYKEREQEAARLAKEIENTPQYKHRQAKELEGSEEDRFSAVQRPGSGGDAGPPGPANSNNIQRYVPPQRRSGPPLPQQPQHYSQQHHGRRPIPSQTGPPYRTQHVPRDSHPTEPLQNNVNGSVERGERKVLESSNSVPPTGHPPSAYAGKRKLSDVVRGGPADGGKAASQPTNTSSSSNNSSASSSNPKPPSGTPVPTSELQKQPQQQQQAPPAQPTAPVAATQSQQQTQPPQQQADSQVTNQADRKPSKARSDVGDMKKHEKIEDLKKFGAEFKLQHSSGKTKEAEKGNPKDTKVGESSTAASSAPSSDNPKTTSAPATSTATKSEDITKKSTLNPEAKEFNPQAKPFVPAKVGVAKTPTPPRQQQHSPVVIPAGPQPGNIHTMSYTGQPVYSVSQQYTVMTSTPMQVTMPAAPTMVTGVQVQQKAAYSQKRPPTIVAQQRMQHHQEMAQAGVLPVSAATGPPIVASMGYSNPQFVQYAAQPHTHGAVMNQPMLPQHVQYSPHIQYQQKPATMYRMLTPGHQGQLATSPHQAPQHPYPTQDAPQSGTPVYVAPQPQPHPQPQHQPPQPQPHPSAQPQQHIHHPHAQQRHTPPQQSQQQGQTAQHQPGQMPGQQQAAQQHASHPTPSPVHQVPQVPHSAPPPTQNAHLPHQAHPQQQILYQPAHQMQPPPQALQHTNPQSPQSIHPPPPQPHSQTQAHQMPVASHTPSPHITTVTPVHPQPYPHPHQVQPQVVMVGPQGHGHTHNSSAGGHAGAAGVVATNAPSQIPASYLQGPGHAQQPVHQQYPQNN